MESDRKGYPLMNKKILVTRPLDSVDEFVKLLEKEKAIPVIFPTIETVPCELKEDDLKKIRSIDSYDVIIFTSARGVDFFFRILESLGLTYPPGKVTFAIGPATKRKLEEYKVEGVSIPEEYVAEGILELLDDVGDKRILIPRALRAREVLPVELKKRKAIVDVIPIYDTVTKRYSSLPDFFSLDVLTFTSPSTFKAFVEIVGDEAARKLLSSKIVASIGPITSKAIRDYGFHVQIESKVHTVEGLVRAIRDYFSSF
ncbi:MAG: uroporphyrinogen-III synthase [Thermosulfidibacteraceae bacterium]